MGVMNSGIEALIVQCSYSWSLDTSDTLELDNTVTFDRYSQETLQCKNIHKYKPQMIYFRNCTVTPTHLLAQFLRVP